MNKKTKKGKKRILPFKRAARKLRSTILIFLVCLVVPLSYLLFHVYSRLEDDAFLRLRIAAEELTASIDKQALEIIAAEESRAFDQYSFFNVSESKLFSKKQASFSPLAALPPQSSVPGLIGYFQINPDGSFHSPVLPDIDTATIESGFSGMTSAELRRRRAFKNNLEGMLAGSRLTIYLKKKTIDNFGLNNKIDGKAHSFANEESVQPQVAVPIQEAYKDNKQRQVSKLDLDDSLFSKQKQTSDNRYFERGIGKKSSGSFFSRAKSKKQSLNVANQALVLQDKIQTPQWGKAEEEQAGGVSGQVRYPQQAQRRVPSEDKQIITLEGEIDSFKMQLLPSGRLVFFRKVWTGKERYIQGFLVKIDNFIKTGVEDLYRQSRIGISSKLIIAYQDKILRELTPYQGRFNIQKVFKSRVSSIDQGGVLIYRDTLSSPLKGFELVYTVNSISDGTEERIINTVVISFILILLGGLFVFYRLGMGHIRLAQERSDFVSAVSHELKTPLTSIRMYSEMLRSNWVADEEKKRSYFDYIFFESERLSRLIGNVLKLARLTRNDADLDLREYPPTELMDLVRSKVSSQIEASEFQLYLSIPEERPEDLTVLAEDDAFIQVFINLVDNAIKFSKDAEKKQIDIGFQVRGGTHSEVIFFVRDYGPGVPKEQQKKIFKLFYRAGSELTRTTPGTGIGLSLVKELTDRMNASVDLVNKTPGAEIRIVFKVID